MKNLKIILTTLIALGFISGCDLLDNQEAQQSLPTEEVINTGGGLENIVTGIYDGLQDADVSGGNFNVLPEIMADNVSWSGSFVNYARQAAREMLPSDGQIESWWNDSYREINSANLLLAITDDIEDPLFTEDDADLVKGEAYFARGMLYFELARVYAKPWDFTSDNSHDAVPIRTDPVTEVEDFEDLPRESLSDVFEQVESDLLNAADLLPDVGLRADRRATRYAALTYLMRLELEKQNFSEAADYADDIITSGFFSLTDHPVGPFENEFSSESIFEISHTSQDNPGVNAGQNAFYASTADDGRGDIQYTSDYVSALNSTVSEEQQAEIEAAGYEAVDLRATLIDTNTTATVKFPDGANNADNVLNARYAEVLLSRAEALVEIASSIGDVPEEAYELLNEVRTRSLVVTDETGSDFTETIEYEDGDFASIEEMIDAIILERRVELAFEGDRFHTLKRRGMDIGGLDPEDNRITFPIPQGEIDANPEIGSEGQNEGY